MLFPLWQWKLREGFVLRNIKLLKNCEVYAVLVACHIVEQGEAIEIRMVSSGTFRTVV